MLILVFYWILIMTYLPLNKNKFVAVCHMERNSLLSLPSDINLCQKSSPVKWLCRLLVMLINKDRIWWCGLSLMRDISHGINQWCSSGNSDWCRIPANLCAKDISDLCYFGWIIRNEFQFCSVTCLILYFVFFLLEYWKFKTWYVNN